MCLHGAGTIILEDCEFKQRCVVPIVGFPVRDFALDRVSNDREKLLSAPIWWIAQLHQGYCIYTGIGIAPVCFESTEIHFDLSTAEVNCVFKVSEHFPGDFARCIN